MRWRAKWLIRRRADAMVLKCFEARARFECCASRETTYTRKRGGIVLWCASSAALRAGDWGP